MTCINCGSVNAGYDLLCAPCRDNEFNNAPVSHLNPHTPRETGLADTASTEAAPRPSAFVSSARANGDQQ